MEPLLIRSAQPPEALTPTRVEAKAVGNVGAPDASAAGAQSIRARGRPNKTLATPPFPHLLPAARALRTFAAAPAESDAERVTAAFAASKERLQEREQAASAETRRAERAPKQVLKPKQCTNTV